jgi:hypothetical protein
VSIDTFQINNQQGQSIDSLMHELSEYRNNASLYTIEKCDLKHLFYDTLHSLYRPNLMTYTGSVVGLSMLSAASQQLTLINQVLKMGSSGMKALVWRWFITSIPFKKGHPILPTESCCNPLI